MKKIFMVFIFLIAFTFTALAQETNVVAKRKGLLPPYVGFAIGLEHLFYPSIDKPVEDIYHNYSIDLTLGKKVYFSSEVGFSMPFDKYHFVDSVLGPVNKIYFGNFSIGAGLYIFDKRVENKGHSLTINARYSTKTGANNKGFLYHDYFLVGGEVSSFYNHSIYKHLTLRVGVKFGVYQNNDDVAINYGLSVGLAF